MKKFLFIFLLISVSLNVFSQETQYKTISNILYYDNVKQNSDVYLKERCVLIFIIRQQERFCNHRLVPRRRINREEQRTSRWISKTKISASSVLITGYRRWYNACIH